MFLSFAAFLGLMYFLPDLSSARIKLFLSSIVVLFWIVPFLLLWQLFNKNEVLLQVFRGEVLGEQRAAIKNSLNKRLCFMKLLFASFILVEVITIYIYYYGIVL
jgi:hypothetical protein